MGTATMSATGLETFDRSIHATNFWLKELSRELGVDRQTAWRVLGVVLRALRDRLPVEEAAHFSAQLPLLIRGAFYEQYRPALQPEATRWREEFILRVAEGLGDIAFLDPEAVIAAVLSSATFRTAKPRKSNTRCRETSGRSGGRTTAPANSNMERVQ
jgi:uncharacterized protein (DUF2267 family)